MYTSYVFLPLTESEIDAVQNFNLFVHNLKDLLRKLFHVVDMLPFYSYPMYCISIMIQNMHYLSYTNALSTGHRKSLVIYVALLYTQCYI